MNNFKKILLISISLIFVQNLSSQEIYIDLSKCIQNALKNNPEIVQSQYSIDAQRVNIKGEYGDLLPTLTMSTGVTRTNQVSTATNSTVSYYSGSSLSTNQTTENYNFSLNSSVTLFNGFSNYESIESAKMTEKHLLIQYEKAKQDLVLKIIGYFIEAIKNQHLVKVHEDILAESQLQLEKIKKFVEVGKKTMSDIYTQDVTVGQNELNLEKAIVTYEKSVSDLISASYLSLDKSYRINMDEFKIDFTMDDINLWYKNNSNPAVLYSNALKNRNDYKAYSQIIKINELNSEIARNTVIFPTLTGSSTYSLSGSKINNMWDSRVFTLGLTLSYPIFQGFDLDNQRQQAVITLKSSYEDLRQLESQIYLDIKKTLLDLKSLIKQIDIAERNLILSQQNVLLAEESYRVGLGTVLDIESATVKHYKNLVDKYTAIYNFINKQKQLEYYQGLLKY